ncbi:molecular chaperone GrpE [Anaerocolumna jejuensis DSM 15929]|uniref:Protein GrpE n=1 Tax=Anaerocolumna jejuensis DSM 15929 TaxID=1121322 RepID=A0A1M6KY76_9FIRM|nr:nucleotide exchange factor GrpE [Anaerocolumna jejuensis]SHJ63898.1 molecular chaperone GrpE [Anaerocolumna jejuensis DSM 15929]
MEDKKNSMDETVKEKDIKADPEASTEETKEVRGDKTLDTPLEESDIEMAEEENSEDEDAEDTPKDDQKSGKSFFRKDKKEKKDKKDLKIEELNDRLIRNMAEFDNFRKRSEREKTQMFEIGARDIIEKILPVIDNFERGLGAISEEERESAFAQGIEKIYKQMFAALSDAGLKPIDAVGKPFDPNFHNAVMHAEDPEQGENLVAEEFQKGYTYRDTVVRHSMVKVVN